MPTDPLRRGLVLLLLGMGAFFLIAALLTGVLSPVAGNWPHLLVAVAVVAVILAVPLAYRLWQYFLANRD